MPPAELLSPRSFFRQVFLARLAPSLKSAFARAHPEYGAFNAKAVPVRLSDQESAHPVSMIHIPSNAQVGFYELATSIHEGSVTTTDGTVIRVAG